MVEDRAGRDIPTKEVLSTSELITTGTNDY